MPRRRTFVDTNSWLNSSLFAFNCPQRTVSTDHNFNMKTRSIRIATFIIIAIATFVPALSQTNFTQPRAVSFDRVTRRLFPTYYGAAEYQQLMSEGFYPIGWSRDGKFAYYVEPPDEACGCYFAELVIQDLKTDKEVWKFKNDPESRTNPKGEILDDDIRRLWRRNQKMFSKKLREHRIIPLRRFALLGTSFSIGGKAYTANLTAQKSKDDEYDMERVMKMKVSLSTASLGNKSLSDIAYKGDEANNAPLEAALAGVFKSPYENRVAIVLFKVFRGWEGPPHTLDTQIIGADLRMGFRK